MSEAEPRRSVRSTKGQHNARDQLDQALEAPKRKQGKKGKKAAAQEEKEEADEEEVIRCVCGAVDQEEDSGEPWIACDDCGVWQHNVCVNVSTFEDEIPDKYFCEQCRPENHEELLQGMARGEKPWEGRRQAYEKMEAEEAERRKKKGGRKGRKRQSGIKDDASQSKPSPSPAPDTKKDGGAKGGAKRKARDDTHDDTVSKRPRKDSSRNSLTPTKGSQKIRKISESESVPVVPYEPPKDLAAKISELADARQGPAKLLLKSLLHALNTVNKQGLLPSSDTPIDARAEQYALQIEAEVQASHPALKDYGHQIRTLSHNLKSNQELSNRLAAQTLTPRMLATMTTEQLASAELRRETAELRAKVEKQSILPKQEAPRIRRTHKGEEVIEEDERSAAPEEAPRTIRRFSVREPQPDAGNPNLEQSPENPVELPDTLDYQPKAGQPQPLRIQTDTQQSPRQGDFDISKIFSAKSPGAEQRRRSSMMNTPSAGPGFDPDVDRLLDDGNESPPYSPTEETDPDVVWRGNLIMNSLADAQAVMKHAAGCNLAQTINLPWSKLVPHTLTVAGRIDEMKATEYLCSLRYNKAIDVVIASLTPTTEAGKKEFNAVCEYFASKKRYGVIGEKSSTNVRDTYLVPIPPGKDNFPEFLLNLYDNYVPSERTENLLLIVFVYRNEDKVMAQLEGEDWKTKKPLSASKQLDGAPPTPAMGAALSQQRQPSVSGPTFSPASPQGTFPPSEYASRPNSQTPVPSVPRQTPVPIPAYPKTPTPAPQAVLHQQAAAAPARPNGGENQQALQLQGERIARDVLGPLINSPTVGFLLPQAYRMVRNEWDVIKQILVNDEQSQTDLPHLSMLLEKRGDMRDMEKKGSPGQQIPPQAQPQGTAMSPTPPGNHPHGPPQVPYQQGMPAAPQAPQARN